MRKVPQILILLTLAAGLGLSPDAAFAAGGGGGHGAKTEAKGHGEAKPKEEGGLFGSADNVVPLPPVIVPVIVHGKIGYHVYLYLAAVTADASEAAKVTARMPYVQDAIVREIHKDFPAANTVAEQPDLRPLMERIRSAANSALEKPLVSDFKVGQIDTAPY